MADRDPSTRRARLSYRRAAELFTVTTGWTLYQLRHTRIREFKDVGCPLPILQKITRHASLCTLTEHYPGPSPVAVRSSYSATDPDARRRGPPRHEGRSDRDQGPAPPAGRVRSDPRKATAASVAELRRLVDGLNASTLIGARDQAVVLLGFA